MGEKEINTQCQGVRGGMRERKLVKVLEKGQWCAGKVDSVKSSLGR